MDPKQVFYSILKNEEEYKELQFSKLKYSKQDEILLIFMKQVFFYNGNKFRIKKIKEKMQEHEWIYSFIEGIITTFVLHKENDAIYEMVIKYFYDDYDKVKLYFAQFINEMKKIRTKINFDLFEVAVCFISSLNGNNKYLDIISYLKNYNTIKYLEVYNDIEMTKKTLYELITKYCILYKYPVIFPKEYKNDVITKERIIEQLNLFRCYAELCPISNALSNFLLSLYSCLKNGDDLRINREKNVAEFIEELFILINLHLKIPDYWKDENILKITDDIYDAAFKYASDNFDNNYIDFVISYITHYEIPTEDFMNYFLKGLNEDEFNLTFKNCQIKENIGN